MASVFTTVTSFVYVILICCLRHCACSYEAKKLYEKLLGADGEYNKLIRPVGNSSDTLIVKVGLRLSQIIDVVR